MKRRISAVILTLLVMSLSCAGVFSAWAGEATDYSSNLVVHYDFRGTTAEEALRDKAPQGTADNLEFVAFDGDNNFNDGAKGLAEDDYSYNLEKGTVKKVAANNSQLKTVNKVSSDYDAIKTSATLLLRFKIDSKMYQSGNFSQLFWLRWNNGNRVFYIDYKDNQITNHLSSCDNATSAGNDFKTANVLISNCTAKDTYVNYMVTYEGTANGGITMKVYTCIGDDFDTWQQMGEPVTTANSVLAPTEKDIYARFMGPWSNVDTESTGLEMDDIRLYNTVLATADMGSILTADFAAGKLDKSVSTPVDNGGGSSDLDNGNAAQNPESSSSETEDTATVTEEVASETEGSSEPRKGCKAILASSGICLIASLGCAVAVTAKKKH